MKYLIYKYILKPLILRNYRARMTGLKPDKWYWADELAAKWGFSIDWDEVFIRYGK